MIGYLKGEAWDGAGKSKILLKLSNGPQSVVGYSVTVPDRQPYTEYVDGRTVELFIYTHVRPEVLDLFGFVSLMEKECFLDLLTVSGIGPKVALGVLSQVTPSQLVDVVLGADKNSLVRIPGVGKKTAERLVLELKDTFRKKAEEGHYLTSKSEALKAPISGRGVSSDRVAEISMIREARSALVALGYREQEAAEAISKAIENRSPVTMKTEDLIRTALQQFRV